jgi:hypothetical protein
MVDIISSALTFFFIFGILSFLHTDNVWFRFVTRTFVAFTSAHYLVLATQFIQSNALLPIIGGEVLLIIPLIIGLLTLGRLSKTYGWINMYPVAVMVSVGIGLSMRSNAISTIININKTILAPTSIDNIIIIICAVCTIVYFIFTRKDEGILKYPTQIGRYALMLTFGALYANYGLTRFTYLLNTVQRLLTALGLYT